jgi:CheY-like chemotaxis protein
MSIDRRILIADDDDDARQGTAELLGPLGVDIVLVDNGVDALELVRRRDLHLALLDNRMPGLTGLEILQAIRSEVLGVPAILCSGDVREHADLVRFAQAAGAFAVLPKPIAPSRLKQEVVRALDLPPTMGLSGDA